MSETKVVTVTKVGGPPPSVKGGTRKASHKKPKFGVLKRGKTARNKPRFEAVRDPTSSPPLRILTSKGEKTRRARISEDSKKIPIQVICEILKKNKLPISNKKEPIIRKIYEDAQEAGMLSNA
jgi:hypothetical protein